MIELTSRPSPDAAASLVLLPNRSLTRAGLWGFVALQGLAAVGFAVIAAWRGNVLAPLFAVLEMGIVALCLWRVWRSSGCGEIVALTPTRIDVTRTAQLQPIASFHPYWARLTLQPARRFGWPTRLVLASHGREVEIGAFLRDDERRALARQLARLIATSLADSKATAGNGTNFDQGDANEAF